MRALWRAETYFPWTLAAACLLAGTLMAMSMAPGASGAAASLVHRVDASPPGLLAQVGPASPAVSGCGQCGGGPRENLPNQLDGVSCTSATSCVAVGSYYQDALTARLTLIESWDGRTWSVVPSPNVTPASELAAVSCTSATLCVAVGSSGAGHGNSWPTDNSLVESWNGTVWSVVPSPNPDSPDNVLNSVSCTSSTSCVAVGASGDLYGVNHTLIESWNGTAWSVVPSPNPDSPDNQLRSVSCISPTVCVAAGYSGAPGADRTLVESWNGSTWSVVPSPSPGSTDVLSGVSCISTTDCVAVGSQGSGTTIVYQTLIESWDGSAWSIVQSPSYGPSINSLSSVSCTSASNCVAVGDWITGGPGEFRTLVESWNGVFWSILPAPSPSPLNGDWLLGVSCTSQTSCVAVGMYANAQGEDLTLVESLVGTTWTTVPSPNVRVLLAPVVGMAATPAGDGYWVADSAGDVTTHGAAVNYGSMGGQPLNAPVTHIVSTSDGKGYWLVAADGGTFSFGDAQFYGSMGGRKLNAPVVDMAPTPSGHGYWLVASDGGVFAFGDAAFRGSMGGRHLNKPMVGMSTDSTTGGYWLVASDGGIFSFGAPFFGSTGAMALNQPVLSMASANDGGGYWFAASDGGVFAFGDAAFHGSMGGQRLNGPVVGMAADHATGGYWLVASDAGIFSFDAPFFGAG